MDPMKIPHYARFQPTEPDYLVKARAAAIRQLGSRWVCDKTNHVKKVPCNG